MDIFLSELMQSEKFIEYFVIYIEKYEIYLKDIENVLCNEIFLFL